MSKVAASKTPRTAKAPVTAKAGKSAETKKTATPSKAEKKQTAQVEAGKKAATARKTDAVDVKAPAEKKTTAKKAGEKATVAETVGSVKSQMTSLTDLLGGLPASQRKLLTDFMGGVSTSLPEGLQPVFNAMQSELGSIGGQINALDVAEQTAALGMLGLKNIAHFGKRVLDALGVFPPFNYSGQHIDNIFGQNRKNGPLAAETAATFSAGPSFDELKAGFEEKGLKPEDASMMALQEQQQRYNRMLTLLTQMLQMGHEGLKTIAQNLRS